MASKLISFTLTRVNANDCDRRLGVAPGLKYMGDMGPNHALLALQQSQLLLLLDGSNRLRLVQVR